jgi:cell division protease FtsH
MVTRWGMSERLGPRTFGKSEEMIFLGREISEQRNYSEKVAEEIDEEIRKLIEAAQERARATLRERRLLLDKLAAVLLEVETLEGEELTRLLTSDPNEAWPPPDTDTKSPPPAVEAKESAQPKPTFEPRPAPGLAWEGGNQANIKGGGEGGAG